LEAYEAIGFCISVKRYSLVVYINTNNKTDTSPFNLLYGRHPQLHVDLHRALPTPAATADNRERIGVTSTVLQEAARATC
jgi:hypothetical protein